MTINNSFNPLKKYISCSSISLGTWAILSGIACAAPSNEDVKSIQGQLSGFWGFFNLDEMIYILSAVVIITLIIAIILGKISIDAINKTNKNVNRLKQEVEALKEQLNESKEKQDQIKVELYKENKKQFNDIIDTQIIKEKPIDVKQIEPEKKVDLEAEYKKQLKKKWKEIIRDYNAISNGNLTGFEARQSRDEFIQKYDVKTFYCDNYEALLNDSSIKPIFKDSKDNDDKSSKDYWAILFDKNNYAVVPRLNLSYAKQTHETAGMKEVFDSNYQDGLYKHILVIDPAYFEYVNGTWAFEQKGKLKLSR